MYVVNTRKSTRVPIIRYTDVMQIMVTLPGDHSNTIGDQVDHAALGSKLECSFGLDFKYKPFSS